MIYALFISMYLGFYKIMFSSLPLKYKMILGTLFSIIVPFIIASIITYTYLSDSLLQITKNKSLYIAEDLANLIETSINNEINMASSIASDPDIIEAVKTNNYKIANLELDSICKRVKNTFFTIFLTDKNGFY